MSQTLHVREIYPSFLFLLPPPLGSVCCESGCHSQITVSLLKLIELQVVCLSGCLLHTWVLDHLGFSGWSGILEINLD